MRSPLSSFLAEAVMQDPDHHNITNNDDIETWDRCVDDVLAKRTKQTTSYKQLTTPLRTSNLPKKKNMTTNKTHITEKHNAIYIFPCKNSPDKYIGQTSKKIQTRLTEHQNAINRHDHSSHKFDWSEKRCLGQATTKHAREFKEAWHSLDKQTYNRHIDMPTIYLQLKRSHKSPNSSSLTFNTPSTSFPTPAHDNNNHPQWRNP